MPRRRRSKDCALKVSKKRRRIWIIGKSGRLQLAHLPFVKTFDQFDFGFQPSIDEKQIRELRSLRFVHEASNVILLGPPGVGKTHLSVALGSHEVPRVCAILLRCDRGNEGSDGGAARSLGRIIDA